MIVAIRTLFTLPQPLNILRVWHLTTGTRTCLNINLFLKSLKYGINKMVYPKLPFCRIYAVNGKEISIFCRFELENMSVYEILPALDLTQSVHAKISIGMHRIYEILPALDLTQSVHAKIFIGMHRVVKFKISRIPLIGLETRLG
jgi:hypothetical protein